MRTVFPLFVFFFSSLLSSPPRGLRPDRVPGNSGRDTPLIYSLKNASARGKAGREAEKTPLHGSSSFLLPLPGAEEGNAEGRTGCPKAEKQQQEGLQKSFRQSKFLFGLFRKNNSDETLRMRIKRANFLLFSANCLFAAALVFPAAAAGKELEAQMLPQNIPPPETGGALKTAAGGAADEEGRSGGGFHLLQFTQADRSDSFLTQRLTERFESVAAWAFPLRRNPFRCRLLQPDSGGKSGKEAETYLFGATLFGREVRIRLPGPFRTWTKDRESREMLMAWFVLARLELPPEYAERIRDHWIILGLARKAWESFQDTSSLPLSRSCPMAYALESHGIRPSLAKLLSSAVPSQRTSPQARELQAEYAELLLEAADRSGLLKNNRLEGFVKAVLAEKSGVDAMDLFLEFAGPALRRRQVFGKRSGKDTSGKDTGTASREEICGKWFSESMGKLLISSFTPYAAEYFETLYHQAAEITYTDADGQEKVCSLSDLPMKREEIPDLNNKITQLLGHLSFLSTRGAPEFSAPLSQIRLAVTKCRTEGGEAVRDEIARAERQLFSAFSARHALERYLAEAELRFSGPRVCFRNALEALERSEQRSRAVFPAVNRYLDETWDEYP